MPSELRSIDPEAGVLAGCFLLGIALGFAGFTPLLLLATSPSLPFSVVALLGVAGVARRACEAPLPVLPAGFFVKKPNSVDCLPVFCDAGALLPFDLLIPALYDWTRVGRKERTRPSSVENNKTRKLGEREASRCLAASCFCTNE